MKTKILRNVTLGIGCIMLLLTLSSNLVIHKPNIHIAEGSPYGMLQSKSNIYIAEGSPYGMFQSKHIIHIDEDMPTL